MNEGNNYKAKITTARGTFEFEGSQEFIEKQVDKIVDIEKGVPLPGSTDPTAQPKSGARPKAPIVGGGSKKSAIEQPKMLPNLVPKDQIANLREFYDAKKPGSHIEIFAVLSYWLKTGLSINEVSIDEMWTLYKMLQIRAPKVLIQTFRDGKSKRAYFDAARESGKYYLTSFGETFVEHDLPAPTPTKGNK